LAPGGQHEGGHRRLRKVSALSRNSEEVKKKIENQQVSGTEKPGTLQLGAAVAVSHLEFKTVSLRCTGIPGN